MNTIEQIKRALLQGQRVSARQYPTGEFHCAIVELESQLPITKGWQTCADNVLAGLRLKERIYRLHASAIEINQIVGMAALTTTPTANFQGQTKKGHT